MAEMKGPGSVVSKVALWVVPKVVLMEAQKVVQTGSSMDEMSATLTVQIWAAGWDDLEAALWVATMEALKVATTGRR